MGTASTTTGVVKQIAIGAAAVGFGVGLIELLKALHPRWLFGEKASASDHEAKPSAPLRSETAAASPSAAEAAMQVMTAEQQAHVLAVREKLTDDERARFQKAMADEPPEIQKEVGETVLRLSIDEAVAFVRESVLKNANGRKQNRKNPPRKPNGSHPPQAGG